MELKIYKNDIDDILVMMYYNKEAIGFSISDEINTSYRIETSDIDFIKKIYSAVSWEDKYNKEIIISFFTHYEDYIEWL